MTQRIQITQINPRVWLLDDAGEATGYVIAGSEKAAVIDTMNGWADVHAAARQLTDLPLMVINTHGHCDHIFGNIYFEEAFVHPADLPLADEHSHFPEFVSQCQQHGLQMPPFRPVSEGDVIDLGGLHLEIIHLPGHTPGSIVILLQEDRMLFTGDAINRHLWLQLDGCLSAGGAADALQRIMYLTEKADVILHGHAKGPEPVSLMNDLLRGLREIEAGQTQNDLPYRWFGGEARQHPFAEGSVICHPGR